ncbi:magnesium transporter CorA family protein [Aspergillus tanneri]|uniref:CorA metal ion transporter n=1 Tax=Aspergillus tanneri TaxID=1220188 RepID=A0A5M9MB73_9EURO|nr:uncharacterized protein ATNIH1004_011489 [Aspergillus tanneri]KAA8642544.1 hypothetical protein ATNIH1004_011489 [Aspergillus tanneri]
MAPKPSSAREKSPGKFRAGVHPPSPMGSRHSSDDGRTVSSLDRKLSLEEQGEQPEETQFHFFTTHLNSVIQAASIDELTSFYKPFDTLLEAGERSRIWWLHVTSPSDADIEKLSNMFDIHPLTTEDIKMRESREKIELFGPYYFLSLRPPRLIAMPDEVRALSLNVYAIVFREGVLSFTFGNSSHASHVLQRIEEHRSHLALTGDWICYALIDDIVDGFAPYIDRIETGVEVMEDGVSIARPDDIGVALQRIYKFRKEVIRIRQLLNDKIDVLRSFARHCGGSSPMAEIALYLSDIQDHVLTMMANLSQSEEMLSRSQSKYLGQLSWDSTRMRNEIVATLSRLSVIGAIIVPMQFITGLFGMNIRVPGKGRGDGTEPGTPGLYWWFGIFGVILSVICSCLLIAKKMRVI